MAGIIACYTGNPEDTMPFVQKDNVIDDLVKKLNLLSLNGRKRVMYCGLTGKKLETNAFMSPTY